LRGTDMFIPDYFELYELLPRIVYKDHKDKVYKLWAMFDDRFLRTIHSLRKRYGKMIMNDWYWGGQWYERGWRPWHTLTGAMFSQHKWGRAGDLIPADYTAEEIRQDILHDPFHPDFKYITCVEMNVSWLHIDCRNRDKKKNGILLVYPT